LGANTYVVSSVTKLTFTGPLCTPVVYTSYDYSAPVRETRQIWDKMYLIKLLGLFTRVSKDLQKTYMVGNGTGWSVSIISRNVTVRSMPLK
jgi:hypothetical protein